MNKHSNKRGFFLMESSLWSEILFANCRGDGVKNLSSLALSDNYDDRRSSEIFFHISTTFGCEKFSENLCCGSFYSSRTPLIVLFFFIFKTFRATSSSAPIVPCSLARRHGLQEFVRLQRRSEKRTKEKFQSFQRNRTQFHVQPIDKVFCFPFVAILSLCFSQVREIMFFFGFQRSYFVTENTFLSPHARTNFPAIKDSTRKNSLMLGFEVYEAQKSMKWSNSLREMLYEFSRNPRNPHKK